MRIDIVDIRNGLDIHRLGDGTRIRQCLDQRAHFFRPDRYGQSIHLGDTGLQLFLAFPGDQGLGAFRQSLIGSLGSLNSRSVVQSQCVGIFQGLDHGFHLCGGIAVNHVLRQGIDAGDLPLAYRIGSCRENTENVTLDPGILGQLDLVPAGLQGSGAQVFPAGIGIQEHGLRRILRIVDIEEHMVEASHILRDLEATCIDALACAGDLQAEHRTVGFVLKAVHDTLAGRIRSTDGHIVGQCIGRHPVAPHCLQAGIQLIQLSLADILLSRIGQRIVAVAGTVDGRQQMHILRHGDAVRIGQSIDPFGGLCGIGLIYHILRLREHSGDLPLAGNGSVLGEQREQIPVNFCVLRQFDQIPAGVQDPFTHVLPSGICIQVHGLRGGLGIEDVEEQILVCGDILVDLEAGGIVAGTGTGDIQRIHRTVGFIPLDLDITEALAIGRAHGHFVRIGIDGSLIAFDRLHAGIQLGLQLCGNSGLAVLGQLFVSFVSLPDIGHILQAIRHLDLASLGQALDQSGNDLCGVRIHSLIRHGVQAGNLPGAKHVLRIGKQTEDVVVHLNFRGDLDLIPARLQGVHTQVLPGSVRIQLHGLGGILRIVNVEEHIAGAPELLDEAEAGNINAIRLVGKGQVPDGTVLLILTGLDGADGRAVRCAELQILLSSVKHCVIACDRFIALQQILHQILGQVRLIRLGSLGVQGHGVFDQRQILDIPLHLKLSRIGKLFQFAEQISAIAIHGADIDGTAGLDTGALGINGIHDQVALFDQFIASDLQGAPGLRLDHKALIPVEVEDLAVHIIIEEADFQIIVSLGVQRRMIGEIAFLGGAVKDHLDAALLVAKLHVSLILHSVIGAADLADAVEFVECQESAHQRVFLRGKLNFHERLQGIVHLVIVGNDVAVHIRKLRIVHIQSPEHFVIACLEFLRQLIELVDDAQEQRLPLIIFVGVLSAHGNRPLVKVEHRPSLCLHTEAEAQNLVSVELAGQSAEPEFQIVPLLGLQVEFLGQQRLVAAYNNGHIALDCLVIIVVNRQIHLIQIGDIQIRIGALLDVQDHIRPVAPLEGVLHTAFAGLYLALVGTYDIHRCTHILNSRTNGEQIPIRFKCVQNIHGTRRVLNGAGRRGFFFLTRSGKAQNKDQ